MKAIKFLYLASLVMITSVILIGCQRQQINIAETNQQMVGTPVKIKGKTYRMEVADTPESRQQGLSGRDPIGSDGMVFVFDSAAQHGFWMKDMKFALDFLWIKEGKIVEINRNIPPPTPSGQIPTVYPTQKVDSVIEVVAGFIDQHQIEVGDAVEIGR